MSEMFPPRRRDPAATHQMWTERFRRFHASGTTVAAFCAAEGIAVPTFYQRKRQLARHTPPAQAPTFLPVRIAAEQTQQPDIEVILPSGTRIRFAAHCDTARVAALIRQAEATPC